jgi:hypothetical protein
MKHKIMILLTLVTISCSQKAIAPQTKNGAPTKEYEVAFINTFNVNLFIAVNAKEGFEIGSLQNVVFSKKDLIGKTFTVYYPAEKVMLYKAKARHVNVIE